MSIFHKAVWNYKRHIPIFTSLANSHHIITHPLMTISLLQWVPMSSIENDWKRPASCFILYTRTPHTSLLSHHIHTYIIIISQRKNQCIFTNIHGGVPLRAVVSQLRAERSDGLVPQLGVGRRGPLALEHHAAGPAERSAVVARAYRWKVRD